MIRTTIKISESLVIIGAASDILIYLAGLYAIYYGITLPDLLNLLYGIIKKRLEEDYEKAKREMVH